MKNDKTKYIQEQISEACTQKTSLCITGGKSKTFYGNPIQGHTVSTTEHTGIIEYQPSELVVTVRSGTLLSELESELKTNSQMLAFEPPQHSENTTIGGVIACGLSGPRRMTCGSARDFVLGTTIINGKSEVCRFGGQVMKNVAGYDAARLMVGAQGTLGVLLDISLKVLPINETEVSLSIQTDIERATTSLGRWIQQGLPITASCFLNNTLYIRLGSTRSAITQSIDSVRQTFETEEIDDDFWFSIKNQTHDFFKLDNLWRCSHQISTEFYGDTNKQLLEWNGALRWHHNAENLFDIAERYGGHAQRYPLNGKDQQHNIFQPLQPGLLDIHQRLKRSFDPHSILNPGRLYTEL